MDDLFGALFPLILIAGWILGLFKKKEEKPANKNQSPRPTPSPTPFPSGNDDGEVSATKVDTSRQTESQKYYENKRLEIENLQKEARSDGAIDSSNRLVQERQIYDVIKNSAPNETNQDKQNLGPKKNISIKRNLTKKGLAESVVMAEVLGSPKSLKPYRSVINNRRN
ncbi:hypothetical protein [Aquibacillus saliphilus]|uniref:hypothetical protein n=1 Tax=Aquibacillus saliphilus TaxID=1909422 RepID=UPI001CF0D03C|nr:hypothetical protein [Aquibacillus saliphilus]